MSQVTCVLRRAGRYSRAETSRHTTEGDKEEGGGHRGRGPVRKQSTHPPTQSGGPYGGSRPRIRNSKEGQGVYQYKLCTHVWFVIWEGRSLDWRTENHGSGMVQRLQKKRWRFLSQHLHWALEGEISRRLCCTDTGACESSETNGLREGGDGTFAAPLHTQWSRCAPGRDDYEERTEGRERRTRQREVHHNLQSRTFTWGSAVDGRCLGRTALVNEGNFWRAWVLTKKQQQQIYRVEPQ